MGWRQLTNSRPGIFWKWRRFRVATAYPLSRAQVPISRDGYTFGRRLPADLAHQFGGTAGDRVDRYGGFQIVEESPTACPPFLCVRPVDPIDEFGKGNGRQRGFPLADLLDDLFEERSNRGLLPGWRTPWLATAGDAFFDILHKAFVERCRGAPRLGQGDALRQ